jgi:hypothetical protein
MSSPTEMTTPLLVTAHATQPVDRPAPSVGRRVARAAAVQALQVTCDRRRRAVLEQTILEIDRELAEASRASIG